MTKSIDQIAEALAKGDVIKSGNLTYDFTDVELVMQEMDCDVAEAAYDVAEEIIKGK